jgi:hypothetical protein
MRLASIVLCLACSSVFAAPATRPTTRPAATAVERYLEANPNVSDKVAAAMRRREPCAGMTMEQFRVFGAAKLIVDDLKIQRWSGWVNHPPTDANRFIRGAGARLSPSIYYDLYVDTDTEVIVRMVDRG